jgi:hypothetical protein
MFLNGLQASLEGAPNLGIANLKTLLSISRKRCN